MSIVEEIRALRTRPELLAPAGRFDALEAVLEGGADAVYVGGKRFQMRSHRSDFHFTDEQLETVVNRVHTEGRRVYVTVNSILGAHELDAVRDYLGHLQHIGVDGIIVCDLATIRLAQEVGVSYELHGSTMMNVHDLDQAIVLKELGLDRVVTSRDISIQDAGLLSERAGLPVEYFLHGDMCVAQSGQCYMSGLVFGKSSNRGECMKPCRWVCELVNLGAGDAPIPITEGHLMALRDLSLLRQIPELIEAGICALKIEGRMRDATYLRHVVRLYRDVIDHYCAMPSAFHLESSFTERLFKHRVRELSTLACTGAPSNSTFFDHSGRREPMMLSNGARETSVASEDFVNPQFDVPNGTNERNLCPELAVCVASLAGAQSAIEAGADRIYLAAETSQFGNERWYPETFGEAARLANSAGVTLGLRTPRVSTRHARAEWTNLVEHCRGLEVQYVLVHHLGALKRARESLPELTIIADYGFNILNPTAAESVIRLGAGVTTPALEAGFEDTRQIILGSGLPTELVVHGPITGMLIDHCLLVSNLSRNGSKDVCRGLCRHARFGLRDKTGEVRHIITDQYCRNHLLTAKDLAVLPCLDAFLRLGAVSFRIEGQFYSPELIGRLTRSYRDALSRWKRGERKVVPSNVEWKGLLAASPRPWNYGGYGFEVTRSKSTAEVMRTLE